MGTGTISAEPRSAAPVSLKATGGVVDRAKCCVTSVLSYPVIDAEGDFVYPDGGTWTNPDYRVNYEHHRYAPGVEGVKYGPQSLPYLPVVIGYSRESLSQEGAPLAVGLKSVTVDGKSVNVPVGTTYFDQNDRRHMQALRMIDEDTMSGVSLEFNPINMRKSDDPKRFLVPDRDPYDVFEWNGITWAHCVAPMNPHARTVKLKAQVEQVHDRLRPIIDTRRIHGEPVDAVFLKALTATVERADGLLAAATAAKKTDHPQTCPACQGKSRKQKTGPYRFVCLNDRCGMVHGLRPTKKNAGLPTVSYPFMAFLSAATPDPIPTTTVKAMPATAPKKRPTDDEDDTDDSELENDAPADDEDADGVPDDLDDEDNDGSPESEDPDDADPAVSGETGDAPDGAGLTMDHPTPQAFGNMIQSLMDFATYADTVAKQGEHPGGKAELRKAGQALRDIASQLAESGQKMFPDAGLQPPTDAAGAGAVDPAAEVPMNKGGSILTKSKREFLRFKVADLTAATLTGSTPAATETPAEGMSQAEIMKAYNRNKRILRQMDAEARRHERVSNR